MSLAYPGYPGQTNVSYISLQNVANCLQEKQKVGSARGDLASRSTFVVLRSLVLFINNLARSAGQLGQNETIFIRTCASAVSLSKGINFFLIPTLAKVDSAGRGG